MHVLLLGALQHPQDHGAPAEEPDSDDPDHDDLTDDEPEESGAPKLKRARQAPPLTQAQRDECKRHMQAVKAGIATNFEFLPPAPTMSRRFKKSAYRLSNTIVWAPQYLFKHLRIPEQPPCPTHGFVHGITEHSNARPRYCSGLTLGTSAWLQGTVNHCKLCRDGVSK